ASIVAHEKGTAHGYRVAQGGCPAHERIRPREDDAKVCDCRQSRPPVSGGTAAVPPVSSPRALTQHLEQNHARSDRHVEALDAATHGNAGDMIASFTRQASHALAFAAHDDAYRSLEVAVVQRLRPVTGKSGQPDAGILEHLEAAGKIRGGHEWNTVGSSRRGASHRGRDAD